MLLCSIFHLPPLIICWKPSLCNLWICLCLCSWIIILRKDTKERSCLSFGFISLSNGYLLCPDFFIWSICLILDIIISLAYISRSSWEMAVVKGLFRNGILLFFKFSFICGESNLAIILSSQIQSFLAGVPYIVIGFR